MENDEIVIERHDHTTHGEYLVSIGPGEAAGKLTWTQRGDARASVRADPRHKCCLLGGAIGSLLLDGSN